MSDTTPPAAGPPARALDLLLDEQSRRWRAGEPVSVEALLEGRPELRGDAEAVLALVYNEVVCRERRGEAPGRDEYLARFPQLEGPLRDQFDVHQAFRAGDLDPTPTLKREAGAAEGTEAVSVPGFEVLGELGRGGMAVVYQAWQAGLNRLVALKMVLAGAHAAPEERARFRTEAEAAARLQHPNIVQVYEVGEHDGRPYLVLEYVDGGSLAQRLAGAPLPAAQAAALAEALARAVDHAHRRGIVHRDLKPGNVLLARSDRPEALPLGIPDPSGPWERYEPKVTDFGLAKVLVGGMDQTGSQAFLGTPSYMAPEQAEGKAREAGPAADVYALGAILYECLTGRPPFRAETPLATLEQVVSQDPVSVRRLQPKVPRDLETVCLKCLRKEPGRRYASAAELADDLRRFVKGEPVRARPAGRAERAVRWALRRPAQAAAYGLLGLVLVLGSVGAVASWLWRQTEAARRRTADALTEAGAARLEVEKAREAEREAGAALARQAYAHRVDLAHREWAAGEVARADRLLDECPPGLRRWEWHHVKRLCNAQLLALRGHSDEVLGLAYSPDGARLATASADRTIRLWEMPAGRERHVLRGHADFVRGVAFSRDGELLASASHDGTVRLWDAESGRERRAIPELAWGVAFSPDGTRLASAGDDRTLKVWDVRGGRAPLTLRGHAARLNGVAFSPDGGRLASASEDRTVRVWDAATGHEEHALTGHTAAVNVVAFSPDGRRLASASDDWTAKVWDVATGGELLTLRGHTDWVSGLAYGPDGRLATASHDRTARVWDAATGRELLVLRGYARRVAFSPDGRHVASTSDDRTVKVWDSSQPQGALHLPGARGSAFGLAFHPDGRRLAVGSGDVGLPFRAGEVAVWDLRTRRAEQTLRGHRGGVSAVAYGPGGRPLCSASADGTARVWDPDGSSEPLTLAGHRGTVFCVAVSPDGRLIATGSGSLASPDTPGEVRLWDARTGREVGALRGHQGIVSGLAFAGEGKTLVTASTDRTLKVWDVDGRREFRTLRGHTGAVADVAVSRDGRRIASASGGGDAFELSKPGEVRVWDAEDGRELLVLRGHTQAVLGVAFSPDGERLASGGRDRRVRVWDARTGQELLTLQGHSQVLKVAFSPDGTRLAGSFWDGSVVVWDATPLGEDDAAK